MTPESDSARARYGWESDFPTFSEAEPRIVRISLEEFLGETGDSQDPRLGRLHPEDPGGGWQGRRD